MNNLALYAFSGLDNYANPAVAPALFGAVITVAAFIFALASSWIKSQREEREAYYKAEALRRIAEMPGESAKLALEHLLGSAKKEDEALKAQKQIAGMRLGGLINVGVGIALAVFMCALGEKQVAFVGLFPGLVGVALLVYAAFFAPRPPFHL